LQPSQTRSPKSKSLGKRDQFPLENGTLRATGPDFDITQERCMLIDPCQENPEDFITFGIDGVPVAIEGNEKGKISIKVFHLDQVKANRARMEKMARYIKLFDLLETLIIILQRHPEDQEVVNEVVKSLEVWGQEFKSSTLESAEFSCAAKAIKSRPTFYGITDEKAKLVENFISKIRSL
jgi:hypothetical protein